MLANDVNGWLFPKYVQNMGCSLSYGYIYIYITSTGIMLYPNSTGVSTMLVAIDNPYRAAAPRYPLVNSYIAIENGDL